MALAVELQGSGVKVSEQRTTDLRNALLVSAILLLSGCVKHTQYGDCVGIGDDQDPKLKYKLSSRNLAVGIIFFELIVPPIKVAVDETYCPVGYKDKEPPK